VSYLKRARARIAAGEHRAGRAPGSVRVGQALVASIDHDGRVARERIRPLVAIYLTRFPNIARETELDPGYIARVNDAMALGGVPAAAKLVSDEVLDLLVIAGSPAECRDRVRDYHRAGVELPVIAAIGEDLRLAVEEFAPDRF
jgi:5,10-methylenetetrahydromethanopterin reductase